MAYLSEYQYYENEGTAPTNKNWGSYQYVSLEDIVNNFMLMYSGNHSLINNEEQYKVLFHAKRAIQELNYDAFKEIKVLELKLDDEFRFVLPSDYVNWVRISVLRNGVLMPCGENIQANGASSYLQNSQGKILFDSDGNIESETSELDTLRITQQLKTMYLNGNSPYNNQYGYNYDGRWYFDFEIGARFGLNTETANMNPTFRIDSKAGVINFDSSLDDEVVVVEYVSDGMEGGDNTLITVNKLFEDYVYAYIQYAILNSKLGVQEYIVNRARKSKTALLRNAKIRISNIHPGRLLMNLRGRDKWIK